MAVKFFLESTSGQVSNNLQQVHAACMYVYVGVYSFVCMYVCMYVCKLSVEVVHRHVREVK